MPGPTVFNLSEEEGDKVYKAGEVNEQLYTKQPDAYKKVREVSKEVSMKDHKFYPTRLRSFFEWIAKNLDDSPYYELLIVAMGEIFASIFLWFPIIMATGYIRSDSGVVTKYGELTPLFLTVFVFATLSHYLCRRWSCDANPMISFYRGFLPDISRYPVRYSGVKMDESKYRGQWAINAFLITSVKIIAQFGAALIIISMAHILEPKGNLGFPNGVGIYDALGYPYMMASAAGGYSRSGTALFIAAFMHGLVFLYSHLEFVKIRGHGFSSLYIGLGTTCAYMISYYSTGATLNIWLPVAAIIFHSDSANQPHGAIYTPLVLGYGFATFMWMFLFRVTSQSGVLKFKKN